VGEIQMDKYWDVVEVLRYARHDWLNKIQLIKGNLALNRPERVQNIIEEIVMEAQQEARLSNLQLPRFASLLLVTNWNNHHFKLEYEVLGDIQSVKMDDTLLTNWTKKFFDSLDSCIEAFQDNHLSISITPLESTLVCEFDFSGSVFNQEIIASFLKDSNVKMKDLTESEFSFELVWDIK
jgi:stage 0 sporulation protein B (sporulation initiation phosphotransferase)